MTTRGLVAWCALAVSGCTQYHVQLPAPPPTLTPEQRVATFMAYKPARVSTLHMSDDGGQSRSLANTTVILANAGSLAVRT
jgi:hypothetical protein